MSITITAAKQISGYLQQIDPGDPGEDWATVEDMLREIPGLYGGNKRRIYKALDKEIAAGRVEKRVFREKMYYRQK